MTDRERDARDLMMRVFDSMNGPPEESEAAEYDRRRREFGFHMTDWLSDLEGLHGILSAPRSQSPEVCASEVYGMLFHIVPHLRAAFRAMDGREAPDCFLEMERKEARV